MNLKKIKRAIISVSDKSNLKAILPTLKKFNIDIMSSGGTFKKIKNMKYNCAEISNYTDTSEMLEDIPERQIVVADRVARTVPLERGVLRAHARDQLVHLHHVVDCRQHQHRLRALRVQDPAA